LTQQGLLGPNDKHKNCGIITVSRITDGKVPAESNAKCTQQQQQRWTLLRLMCGWLSVGSDAVSDAVSLGGDIYLTLLQSNLSAAGCIIQSITIFVIEGDNKSRYNSPEKSKHSI